MNKQVVFVALLTVCCLLLICSCGKESSDNMQGVKMTAIIKNIDGKIEVEVVEGEYGASGIYWVNVGADTVYLDGNGNVISKSALKSGDTVEITYGGQVMMSYPPQIVAKQIQIK